MERADGALRRRRDGAHVRLGRVLLPPRGHLRPTGRVDYIEYYYRGGLALALRERLRWVRQALPRERCARLLEIGYGSGVFFYEAVRHAEHVIGIDVHPCAAEVQRRCGAHGVAVTTIQGDGCVLPFANGSMDVVVIISALEFMEEPARCLRESLRVLRRGGRVIALAPRIHRWSDTLWRAFTGAHPEAEFRGGRQRVERALADVERSDPRVLIQRHPRPRPLPRTLAPYDLLVMHRRARRETRRAGQRLDSRAVPQVAD